ncbi:MAG: hypothetical protein ACTS4V_01905 [Candidatus Hodgkinia cicadicola]
MSAPHLRNNSANVNNLPPHFRKCVHVLQSLLRFGATYVANATIATQFTRRMSFHQPQTHPLLRRSLAKRTNHVTSPRTLPFVKFLLRPNNQFTWTSQNTIGLSFERSLRSV